MLNVAQTLTKTQISGKVIAREGGGRERERERERER